MITTTDISAATEKKNPTYKISKNKKKDVMVKSFLY